MGALVALGVLTLAAVGARADAPACDWPMYGRDLGRSFAAPVECSSITPLNAATLVPTWHVPTGSPVTASPTVHDGAVIVGPNSGPLYSFDAATGEVRWTFEIDDGNQNYVGKIVGSAAAAEIDGTDIVVFPGGSTLYMLDASNGSELARLCTDPRAPDEPRCQDSSFDIDILSSPAIVEVDGETWVIVGTDVHNRRNVGRTGILASRLTSDPWALEPIWKFDPETRLSYTTDASKAGGDGFVHAADPVTHDHGNGDGCGGVWSSPAVDTDNGMVFFGTASCSKDGVLSGESMFGIDLRSGAFRWAYNPRTDRGESTRLDDDFGASAQLLPGDVVGEGGKDGWYYARDRVTGGEVFGAHVGQAGHVNPDFAIGGMIGTSAVGEVFDEPAVFATTAISTPVGDPFAEDFSRFDATLAEDPGRMFSIHAISARDGRLLWRSPLSRQSYGAPTYARGVLFVPATVDFAVNVFDADTGVLLRRLPLEGAPSSAPAIVGDSIYVGSGTSVEPFPFDNLAGVWAFRLAG